MKIRGFKELELTPEDYAKLEEANYKPLDYTPLEDFYNPHSTLCKKLYEF